MNSLTSYFFSLRQIAVCGAFALVALFASQTAIAQTTWYFSPPTGFDLNTLGNWWSNSDGTGTNPTSFDASDTWRWNGRAFTSGTFPVNLTTGGATAELDARSQSHFYESVTIANSGRLNVIPRVNTQDNNSIEINNLVITPNANTAAAVRFLTDTGNSRSFGGTTAGTGITINNLTATGDVSNMSIYFGDGSSSSSLFTNVTIGDTSGFNGLLWARNTQFGLWDNLVLTEPGARFQVSSTTGINFRSFNITTAADGFLLGARVLDAGTYTVAELNTLATTFAPNVTFSGTGQLTVVPEPATYALIFGGLALGLVFIRRKFFK
jgi:hypothetical protein